jgi:hypothetical protein
MTTEVCTISLAATGKLASKKNGHVCGNLLQQLVEQTHVQLHLGRRACLLAGALGTREGSPEAACLSEMEFGLK